MFTNKEKNKKRRKRRNPEDIDQTIHEIREEKNRMRRGTVTVLKWVFFPFTSIWLLFKFIFSQKLSLSTKTTVVFTVIFGFLITAYTVFVVFYLKKYLDDAGIDVNFIPALSLISAGVGVIFLIICAAAGSILGNSMMRPLRKMATEIDAITGEDLSLRLKPTDSQDEITELARQINEMLDSLEESFERQSNFVSDASHELKTPLSVISGYNEVLERWGKDEPAVLDEALASIKRESAYMAKIIDQMLLLARLGRLGMSNQKIDLSDTVQQIVQSYEVTAKGCQLIFLSDNEIFVECDKALLVEAVRAIIDNAIKYSPDGGEITVNVANGADGVRISIADKGIGIDEEDIPYSVDRFYRCDKTRGREKGSGLGLTICKNIIEMMDGCIFVSSVKGQGTEFVIKFPQS